MSLNVIYMFNATDGSALVEGLLGDLAAILMSCFIAIGLIHCIKLTRRTWTIIYNKLRFIPLFFLNALFRGVITIYKREGSL